MYVIIDAAGVVRACGATDSLTAPEGGQRLQSDTDPLAGLGVDQEAYWDGQAFGVRARSLSAQEQQFRADVQAVKTFMGAANGSATDAQRDAVLKAFVRVMRRVVRELDE